MFAAGDVTGTGSAETAELEGYLAGTSAARYLGRVDPAGAARTQELRGRLEDARRRAARLDAAYPLKPGWLEWPDAGTIACRCEETPWSAVSAAVADGATDVARGQTGHRLRHGLLPGPGLRPRAAVRGLRRPASPSARLARAESVQD